MKHLKKIVCLAGIVSILCVMPACNMVRETSAVEGLAEEFVGKIHPGKYVYTTPSKDIDVNAATELFMDMPEEEAWEKYHCVSRAADEPWFETEKYTMGFFCTPTRNTFVFELVHEGAWMSYDDNIYTKFLDYKRTEEQLRLVFPDEDLEDYSKEDAIVFCGDYVKYLGYGDIEPEVYAVPLEKIQSIVESMPYTADWAPVPGFTRTLITQEEYDAVVERDGEFAAQNFMYEWAQPLQESQIPWSKKDEAFILLYRGAYEGVPIPSRELSILWSPQYDKPIYIECAMIDEEVLCLEETLPVTSDEAVAKLMIHKGVDVLEDIEIKSVRPVYYSEPTEHETLGEVSLLTPYWEIWYQLRERKEETVGAMSGTARIHAVYGDVTE